MRVKWLEEECNMATTILNDKGWAGGLSELLGNAGNNAISSIINGKIQGMQQQQQKQQFMNQLQQGGYSEPQAQLAQVFQNSPKELLSLLGALSQGSQQPMAENQGNFGQQISESQGIPQQNLMSSLQNGPQSGIQNLQEILNQYAQQGKQQQSQQQIVPEKKFDRPKPLTPAQQLVRNPGMTPADARLAAQKDKFEYQKAKDQFEINEKQQQIADKETLPIYNEITKEAKAAANNDKRLNKQEELIKTGKLNNPLFASAIKTISNGIFGFGIDLSHLLNPESQQFEKLSNDFLKEAKAIFGSRLTDADLNAFLKTVPTLSQSNEGKARVIQSLREFNDATKTRKRVMDGIIKENNGHRPRNLDSLIEERSSAELDGLAEKFKRDFSDVPETQSFAGSLVRAIPKLIF